MKTITYFEEVFYCWECLECGHHNEDSDSPAYTDTVFCGECGTEFVPIEAGY